MNVSFMYSAVTWIGRREIPTVLGQVLCFYASAGGNQIWWQLASKKQALFQPVKGQRRV